MDCKHEEWIKICVICGAVIDDSNYYVETGTDNEIEYIVWTDSITTGELPDGAIGGGG